jgi:hypothetical protein
MERVVTPAEQSRAQMTEKAKGALASDGIAGWGFWSRWVGATILGAGAGWAASSTVYLLLGLTEESVASAPAKVAMFAVDGIAFGAGVGAAQFLVLRRYVDRVSAWVWAAIAGYGIGFALTGVLEETFSEAVGAFTGYALTAVAGGLLPWLFVLRGRVRSSRWWVPASAGGFYLGVFAAIGSAPLLISAFALSTPSTLGQSVGGVELAAAAAAVVGLPLGLTTATAMLLMLRREMSRAYRP